MESEETSTDDQAVDGTSTVFSGATFVFLGLVFELGFSFLAQVAVARYLGSLTYGAVSIGVSILLFATTFALLGLNTGLTRHLPRVNTRTGRRDLLYTGFGWSFAASLTISSPLFVFAREISLRVFSNASLEPVLQIFAVAIPFSVFFRLGVGALQGVSMTRGRIFAQNITLPITRISGVAVVLALSLGTTAAAAAYALPYVIAAAVIGTLVYRHLPLTANRRLKLQSRALLSFSLPLVVSSSMTRVYSQADVLLLGSSSVGTSGVGVYRAVYPLSNLLTVPLIALGFLFLPVVSILHEEGDIVGIREMFQVVSKWIVLPAVPLLLLFILFPSIIIKITFGPEYQGGANTLRILAVAFFIPLLGGPNSKTLISFGHTRFIAGADIITAIANVGLNLLLIPRLGILGAGIATAASYLVQNILYSTRLYLSDRIQPFTPEMVIPTGFGLVGGAGAFIALQMVNVGIVFEIAVYICLILIFVLIIGTVSLGTTEVELAEHIDSRFGSNVAPRVKLLSRK